MADKIVMGYWDCPYCDSKGIPGTTYDCPNCRRQRGKETKFYMKQGKVEYVPGHKVIGADWYCEYCGALNTAGRDTCENCGSPKSESKDDYFSIKEKEEEKKKKEEEQKKKDFAPESPNRSSSFGLWSKLLLMGFALIAFVMLVSWIKEKATPKDCTFEVQKLTWENTVEIDEYRTFQESDWSMPSDGRLLYTNEEVRSYNSVFDHYESVTKSRQVQDGGHYDYDYVDNGDGTFTEQSTFVPEYTTEYYTEDEPVYVQVPVYDTKYYYEIDRWVHERSETTTGNDKNPVWADTDLSDKERVAEKKSKYYMEGNYRYKSFWSYKERQETFEITEGWWKAVEPGQTLSIEVDGDRVTRLQIK